MIGKLLRNLSNLPGWRTGRKIVIIESDDWGSVRMPSLDILEKLKAGGLDMESGDSARYNQNDTLASAADLSELFEVLLSVNDSNGRPMVFTPVSLTANPDFGKIRESGFSQYFFETLPVTFSRFGLSGALDLWKEGINKGIFVPQFHGREHLNVAAWMRALQENDRETRQAFDLGVWGYTNKNRFNVMYQAAFDLELASDLEGQSEILRSGLDLFQRQWGYKASYFVPPNGPLNNSLEKIIASEGIQYISSPKIQIEPLGGGLTKRNFRWLGRKNKWGQSYITRNCFFEPSIPGIDWVGSCLNDISIAFRWQKPAVISTHRVNFTGGLNESNRKNGLAAFRKLARQIISVWPEVEFMTSTELGQLMDGDGVTK
ncbi:MAG: hypothetical protein ACMVP2_06130 [Imperialibacter sp.]|uniref:hypothetical protein n=1 Tax=Imperialibacter sp. TaxID=2038411 RepID=UPI003A8601E9